MKRNWSQFGLFYYFLWFFKDKQIKWNMQNKWREMNIWIKSGINESHWIWRENTSHGPCSKSKTQSFNYYISIHINGQCTHKHGQRINSQSFTHLSATSAHPWHTHHFSETLRFTYTIITHISEVNAHASKSNMHKPMVHTGKHTRGYKWHKP